MISQHDNRKPKRIWFYSTTNGTLIQEGEAQPDPLEATNWLIPSNATTVEPPVQKKGWVSTFDGEKWTAKKA
jgi:hypothetical protein